MRAASATVEFRWPTDLPEGSIVDRKVANLKEPPALFFDIEKNAGGYFTNTPCYRLCALSWSATRSSASLRFRPLFGPRPAGFSADATAALTLNKQLCCYELFTTGLLLVASCASGGLFRYAFRKGARIFLLLSILFETRAPKIRERESGTTRASSVVMGG